MTGVVAAVAVVEIAIVASLRTANEAVATNGGAAARRAIALPAGFHHASLVAAVCIAGVTVVAAFAAYDQSIAAVAGVTLSVLIEVFLTGVGDERAVVETAGNTIFVGIVILNTEIVAKDEKPCALTCLLYTSDAADE